jgi:hypothetical protein
VIETILSECPELVVELDNAEKPPMHYWNELPDSESKSAIRESIVPRILRYNFDKWNSKHKTEENSTKVMEKEHAFNLSTLRHLLAEPGGRQFSLG